MKKRFRFLLLGAVSVLSTLALLAGCASPTAAQPDSPRQTASQEVQLEVPYLSQEDILPTGCEAVSAAMVLQYWEVDVTPGGGGFHAALRSPLPAGGDSSTAQTRTNSLWAPPLRKPATAATPR